MVSKVAGAVDEFKDEFRTAVSASFPADVADVGFGGIVGNFSFLGDTDIIKVLAD